ncbi:ATP phosphoribosyltransferase regulatory subunit [Leptospira fletcheri]|uniref:ATP phosphoribosyltransferase regulatory subunit n=1 Tax=Leptospira fletcheri TaxID=2484981 RepID=A0A4R9GHU4_9LEPT|nr:ATP phosphoribosyltransferase regulatory subunit [Leptospira fletcheri]TGK12308.1 ATP phosphoribosyltransferase regulatory subunit [Leptospira fletcheri]
MTHNPPEFSEKKWIPDGFHFLGPDESSERRDLLNRICERLRAFGYSEVFLPSFDYSSSFLLTVSEEDSSALYRFRDSGGREISPSMDLTVQAVKGMAGFSHHKENQRIFYQGKIFRDYGRGSGSRKEVLQVGAENLGGSGPSAILRILDEVGFLFEELSLSSPLTLVLGNVNLFRSLVDSVGLSVSAQRQLSFLLYKKNLPEIRSFLGSGKEKEIAPILESLCLGFSKSIEDPVYSLSGSNLPQEFRAVLSETKEILSSVKSYKNVQYCLDFTLIPDLEYYTGFVFQGYLSGISGPVVTGGSYDRLYELFSGIQKDACGYAIDVNGLESV